MEVYIAGILHITCYNFLHWSRDHDCL